MANIRNIDAEVGANFIADDAGAPGVAFQTSAAGGNAVAFNKTVISTPTSGLVVFGTSGASIPVLQFQGSALASTTTIKFITGGAAGTYAIRVTSTDGVTLGWIPVLPDAAVTALAF